MHPIYIQFKATSVVSYNIRMLYIYLLSGAYVVDTVIETDYKITVKLKHISIDFTTDISLYK